MIKKEWLLLLLVFCYEVKLCISNFTGASTTEKKSITGDNKSPTWKPHTNQTEGQEGADRGVESASNRPSRVRRSIMQLAGMLRCTTGCDPLAYKSYGCYCGYLGAGDPVDDIDRCCWEHDWCYTNTRCPQLFLYFFRYPWQCSPPGIPQCGTMPETTIAQQCARQLCMCDRAFVQCVRRFPCPRQSVLCKTNPMVALQSIFFGKR
ncbi:basic phospholipase A2 PA-12C-like [Centruroides sculpturatus]|uniref:basic phospholipase A2 PA-12C-like n=2 Tax=Centruroides sculpturatus TaxID=218467 RepID=UPI000C6DA0B1|nr:basic phospholipase A2 PA-12C-like [Centruroides sculpturatus]